jgi:hypothetical protein
MSGGVEPTAPTTINTGDVLITGLNEAQDISIKVISCRELVQENIVRNDLTAVTAKVRVIVRYRNI